jgi:hypothetical protein
LRVEIYNKVKEDVERWLEHAVDELRKNSVDEKTVKSIAKATAATEVARLHNIVMEEFNEFKAEVEERLSRLGVDAETIRRVVDEIYGRLLNDVRQIIDPRIMYVFDAINEQTNSVRDVLDLVNEVLKLELMFEEELKKLKNMLGEERIEELLYKALIKHGVIRRRRRKWAPLIAGLSVLAAIIASFIINPIATLVVLFIVIVVLLRW